MKKIPKIIRIEPSSVCNFLCKHCTTGLRLNKSLGIMSKENFDIIFNKIKHLNFKVAVLYHGGEPLLNKNLFYFVDKMKTISGMVKFVSNASLLTNENINKILNSKLDLVEFSFDGTSCEENNYIRRGGDFIKNSNQIKRLVEKKKKCGSKLKIYISNVIFPKKNKILNVDSPEYLIKTFSKYNEDITIRSFHAIYWPGFPLSVDFGEPIRNNCDHIENVITIRWNGDVVPCCYDLISKKILGNILNESIEDIWNGKEIIDFRRKIKIKEPPEICKGCNLLYTEKYIYEGIIK